jgi:hypothetical protein
MEEAIESNALGHVDEYREISDQPENMTFRGRYAHLDKRLFDLIGNSEDESKDLRMLDFGGGVLSFGSPTAHDFIDEAKRRGFFASVDVIDKNIPQDFSPKYPQVNYSEGMVSAKGTYDVIRALRVLEWIPPEEYEKYREELIAHLKEGGLFIANQRRRNVKSTPGGDEYERFHSGEMLIKIMQKREGKLVPIDLLPEVKVPQPDTVSMTPEDYMQNYSRLREDIRSGKINLVEETARESYETVLGMLRQLEIEALDTDVTKVSYNRQIGFMASSKFADNSNLLEILAENASEVGKWFTKTKSSAKERVYTGKESVGIQSFLRRIFKSQDF